MARYDRLLDEGAAHSPTRHDFHHLSRIPSGNFRFVALDVETACGNSASICQIGLACVGHDNQIQTFSMMVDPAMHFDTFNIRLHGIGPDHVQGAPRFPQALAALLPLLSEHLIIQHSTFDSAAFAAAYAHHNIDPPALRWANSVSIARRAWPELKGHGGHGLASLKQVLGLRFHHHDAGEDARAAAMVVLRAEAHLTLPLDDLIAPAKKKRA
jgi:DNA polymerase-3 subunit epsilon